MSFPASIDGVAEVSVFEPAGAPKGFVLIEVPHGATRRGDYDAVAARMKSRLPSQLEHFFFVNTDVGAPEGALWLGPHLAEAGLTVVVVRCLIPRTFIDSNRVVALSQQGLVVDGLTPAVQGYVTHPDDVAWLVQQHGRYHGLVKGLYDEVCGQQQGLALQLHSFSPRSVGIEKTDEHIVEALHAAYVPEVYATWPERPPVDLISATQDGSFRTAPALMDALQAAYVAAGVPAKQNATYHLHPVTMGYVYAHAHPGQVLCVELNRGLICEPFVPFGVSPIAAGPLEQLVRPIAEIISTALLARP